LKIELRYYFCCLIIMQDGFHILQILLLLVTLCLSAARSETLSSGEDVAGYVTRKIAEADVMVFAKSYCPHCRASRTLLHKLHDDGDHSWTLDIVDLDLMEDNDGPYVQMELLVSL